MATFTVTDPNTGQTITLEGDSPPTEAELENIFSTLAAPQATPQQEAPQQTLEQQGIRTSAPVGPEMQAMIESALNQQPTPDQSIASLQQAQAVAETPEERSFVEQLGQDIIGGAEGALTLISGIVAQPVAGIGGLAAAADPTAPEFAGARLTKKIQDALTFVPRTAEGKQAIANAQGAIEPIAKKIIQFRNFIGDDAFQATGSPEIAAIATAIPEATLELLGANVGKATRLKSGQTVAEFDAQQAALSDVARLEEQGIRQLTTDVLPPESRTGAFLQQQAELVTPGQRTAQQAQREQAVQRLLTDFDITDAARFEGNIVQGLKDSIKASKRQNADLFEQSTGQLAQMGDVPLTRIKNFAQRKLSEQQRLGTGGDPATIAQMENLINLPDNLSFDLVKQVRSTIGNNIGNLKRGAPAQGSADQGLQKQLYKQLTNDMRVFAQRADPELAANWRKADKTFSDFALGLDKPGARNAVRQGDSTPEVVDTLLFSTKRSDQDFLAKNLTPEGKMAAGQRVLQRILSKSSETGTDINPTAFGKQISKNRNQINAMFDKEQQQAILGLRDALKSTERAQAAQVTTATGQQVVPLFALTNPAVLTPGLIQAAIETRPIRNLLVRRNAAKTAREQFAIDEQLNAEITRSGLLGAAVTGATTGAVAQQQQQ